ncbi:MAG: hypothetical protein ABSF22_18970 [Bryobacteraceae bacterium]
MAIKKKTAAPKKRAAGLKRTGAKTRAIAVKRLLLKVEAQMTKPEVKATLGDYIRLIQLSKEMTEEPKTDIKVTWIEEPLIEI